MIDDLLRLRALAERGNALPPKGDAQFVVPIAHQHHRACYRWLAWQPVEDAVVGNEAIPTDAPFLAAKAIPDLVFRQRSQFLFDPAVQRDTARGAMHPLVEPVAPGTRLLIQLIDIGKMDARPEAEFDDAYAALDLALRLWRPRLADTRSDAQTGHEVTKHRV